jgi:hypothetical protein
MEEKLIYVKQLGKGALIFLPYGKLIFPDYIEY